MTTVTLYSYQDDWFTTDDIHETYCDAFAQEVVKVGEVIEIYSADFKQYPASRYFACGHDQIDRAVDNAYDVAEEGSQEWITAITKSGKRDELMLLLEETIDTWATKHGLHPTFSEHVLSGPSLLVKAISEDDYEVMAV